MMTLKPCVVFLLLSLMCVSADDLFDADVAIQTALTAPAATGDAVDEASNEAMKALAKSLLGDASAKQAIENGGAPRSQFSSYCPPLLTPTVPLLLCQKKTSLPPPPPRWRRKTWAAPLVWMRSGKTLSGTLFAAKARR